jgi:hypothetical protein
MSISSNIVALTIGTSLALFSTVSMADTGVAADASIGNLQFQLVDLDLNDGITAGISFRNTDVTSSSTIQNGFGDTAEIQTKSVQSANSDVLFTNVFSPQSSAYAGFEGGSFGAISTKGYQQGSGSFDAQQTLSTNFVLTANTAIVFTGYMAGSANTADSNDANLFSMANSSLLIADNDQESRNRSAYIERNWFLPFNGASSGESFTLTFANKNTASAEVNFLAVAGANGTAVVTAPVPEPETWAMMVAGMGLLGFAARRRKQQQ